MTKKIILIHGRNFKPNKSTLENNWLDALRHGIKRDYGTGTTLDKYDRIPKELVYFGCESEKLLKKKCRKYNEEEDIADRAKCLDTLKSYQQSDFLGDNGKANYEKLPGKSSLKEALADIFGVPLNLFGVSDNLIKAVAPDMREYWNPDTSYGSTVRSQLTKTLAHSLDADSDVLLISHSLGTMISYDTLWKFSYYSEYQHLQDKKLSMWVTLGSPLGNPTVREKLKGAKARYSRCYPINIKRWINIAAEDDFIAHDETLEDDYEYMVDNNMLDSVQDKRIYNLAIRNNKSNPHHSTGYLIHPCMTKIVADWVG